MKNSVDQLDEIEQALQSGIHYLNSQKSGGLYKEDFGLRHGESTAWSTAYVGRLLGAVDPKSVFDSVAPLQKLRNSDGGWGYNEHVPSDADSTVNVLLFLRSLGQIDRAGWDKAVALVKKHQHENGGLGTYSRENVLKMGYRGEGWSSPHVCVTALAAHVLEGDEKAKALAFLNDKRNSDGGWPGYWWASDLYSSLEALKVIGFDEKMVKFFEAKKPQDIFELALKIQGLAAMGRDVSALSADLLAMQKEDGSWEGSAILKVPRPDVAPELVSGSVETARDRKGLFSTANALCALKVIF